MVVICKEGTCQSRAYYAFKYMEPLKCKEHKEEGMKTQTRICKCGKATPHYSFKNDKNPSCCSKCKTDEMINILNKKCKCGKSLPTFGLENDNKPSCCKACKTDIMINIVDKKCICGKSIPCFGLSTDEKARYCKICKTDIMINIKCKKCVCGKAQPCFGLESDKNPTCCSLCKTDLMINIKDKRCVCCKSIPIFGLINDKTATCCKDCKSPDMINIKSKKCKCGKSIPTFGLSTDKNATCCNICKTDNMTNIADKKCKSNYLEDDKKFSCETSANKKYKGYCTRCYAFHFPTDPLTFQIRCKTKEIAVRDFINQIFDGFNHDVPLWLDACKCIHRRRIDHRKLIGNTLLCIETDENQHKYYDEKDERIRYDDLMMIHGGKFIFIRFNPDKYKEKGISKNPMISTRLRALEQEINKQIKRIENEENEDLLEIIPMYFDKK